MLRYLTILIFIICISCKGDIPKNNEILEIDEIDTIISIEKEIIQTTIVPESNVLKDKEDIQKEKELEKIKAEKQLEKDIDNSNLKNISCEEIFKFYEKLILNAKKTKDKNDIRKLNEYKGDPNFRKCRKNPDYKEIYNRLEKLKRSK